MTGAPVGPLHNAIVLKQEQRHRGLIEYRPRPLLIRLSHRGQSVDRLVEPGERGIQRLA